MGTDPVLLAVHLKPFDGPSLDLLRCALSRPHMLVDTTSGHDHAGQLLKRSDGARRATPTKLPSSCLLDVEIVNLQQPDANGLGGPGKYHDTADGSRSWRSSIFWSASAMIPSSLMTSYSSTDAKSSMRSASS